MVVGIFVTVGLGILSAGVLAIGDLNQTFTRKITVGAVFDEVGGLQGGDNIWFSGVKVGRVASLQFKDGSRVAVEMKIDRAASAFIRNDSLAKIGSDGLIGSKIIEIYEGTPGAPHLQDGDQLKIGAGVSTDEMMKTFQENNANLVAITRDLKILTAGLVAGDGTVGRLFSDDVLATQLVDTVTSLQETSVEAQRVTANLSAFTGRLNRPGTLPYDLVTDTTVVASLQQTATKLEQVATDASKVVETIERGAGNPDSPVGVLLGDEKAGADIRTSLANMTVGTRLLNEDLEAAQDTFLLRRAFRRRAVAEAKAAEAEAEAADAE